MKTTRTNVLEEMLEVQEKAKGAGFNYKDLNKKQRNKNSAYPLERHVKHLVFIVNYDINFLLSLPNGCF